MVDAVSSPSSGSIRVMLVDDSAVIRGFITRILEKTTDIQVVGSAGNGQMAVDLIDKADPDIIILDIEMPVMDGLTAIPLLLKKKPNAKILMCSTLSAKGATVTLKAMSLGATDCIVKPTSSGELATSTDFADNLLRLVRAIGGGRSSTATAPRTAGGVASKPDAPVKIHDTPMTYKGKPSLIAVGSSTGGPQALFEVCKSFKGFNVPIVITQHMPATFTAILAQHIEQHCGVPCHEGKEGMVLENGYIYVAPGGFHMHLVDKGGKATIHLDEGAPENFCKPSVDPMFRTAVNIYGNKVLGVILTGMGSDGLSGGKVLVEKGGRVIAQDKATSVVWGMPGAVATAGICAAILPLTQIGAWVRKAAGL
jgi:two-component system chemotaxis response regulator CheB